MLRNIDRKRIYQEEVYRYEVRARLDKTQQKKNKVEGKMWPFVNSAFFLWFLSSVVVGIISFSYAKWDKQSEFERAQRERTALVEQENIQRTRKLDAEIHSRLTYFFYSQDMPKTVRYIITEGSEVMEGPCVEDSSPQLPDTVDHSRPKDVSSVDDGLVETEYKVSVPLSKDGIMSLNNPSQSDYKSGDSEYANKSLLLLLLDLEAVVPPQERNEISLALNRFKKVQPKFESTMKIIRELKKKGKPSNVIIDAETFNEFCRSAKLKRWGVVIPISIEIETEVSEVITKCE